MAPSSTDPSSSLDRHLSSAEETQLAEALELRRKQIDREIAEYRADKEKEFRKFEKRLRSEKRDAERQKILQCEREVEKANFKRRGSKEKLGSPPAVDAGLNGSSIEGGRENGVRFAGATEIPPKSESGQRKKSAGDQQPFHEREVEFQGLFTPTYLPLLSGRQKDELQDDIANAGPSRPEKAPQSSRPVQSSAPAEMSTVAPSSDSTAPIPTSPRHSSSPDPRKMSLSERRSSSRSDTSISSLRSSLRNPKQTRSPKRVLFSINNVVVSPSTSPTMQRKMNAARKSDNGRLETSEIIEGHAEKTYETTSWRCSTSGQSNNKTALTNIPTTNGHSSGSNKLHHPAAQIARRTTSPSMGGDGFEHIGREDDDDLFAFDEDLKYRDIEPQDNDEEGEDGSRDEDLENRNEELPTSSPHAGSLPIEIKWPGRKDPRG